ncbi:MAG TPA: ROK family protein [Rhodocyclaceae bacterium]|jgi:glucokinase|nr:ROK family protein [Rhodocyclaceae bacterium]
MNLVGDIGGTRARLALIDEAYELHYAAVFDNDDYADFAALLGAWLKTLPEMPERGCLAIAAPVTPETRSVHLVNRATWRIDAPALESAYNIAHIALANDFAAAAMGVPSCSSTAKILQDGVVHHDSTCLVIGAGTGLGVAALIHDGSKWRVLPGEGGHFSFAPQNDVQDALNRHLRTIHGRVIAEHVVSGSGLAAIHAFLHGETLAPVQVSQRANAGDARALASFDLFASAYGTIVGDYALAVMARGGVFLAGGIAAANLDLMRRGPFLDAFRHKEAHSGIMAELPVSVLTEPLLALYGAARLIK